MKKVYVVLLLAFLGITEKNQAKEAAKSPVLTTEEASDAIRVVQIKECWQTQYDKNANLDSPAVWVKDGRVNLLVTAKKAKGLRVFDGINGFDGTKKLLFHEEKEGKLERPNGIAVIGDYAFVVDRELRKVQVFDLVEEKSLGNFGNDRLLKPYGIYIHPLSEKRFIVYVTDDFEFDSESNTPACRVKVFGIEIANNKLKEFELDTEFARCFGEAKGANALLKVESIWGDFENDHLLVADEKKNNIQVFNFKGEYKKTIGDGFFRADPEGLVLYAPNKEKKEEGFWICADQQKERTIFHLFARRDFKYLGSFKGELNANTDGVTLYPTPTPRFPKGIFYALHNDGGICAFSIEEINKHLRFL